MSEILLSESAWGIARLTLNRPEQRNALSPALVNALIEALQKLASDESVRVIELSAAGEKAFCAGGDLSGSGLGGDGGALSAHYGRGRFAELLRALRDVGKPVVGVVHGPALGGGFGLAMACDIVIASEDASFGAPEINVGLFPMMIMPILARSIPRKKLLEMILTGDKVSAREAFEWGFVNQVVPRADLRTAADAMLQKLVQKSPAILKLGRDAFYRMSEMSLDPALDYLVSQLTLNLSTEDAMEGLAAFMQKRPPEWKGR
ncbi:MAG: enoyl-CoA hydratase/isomerase family protein [Myxococcota bacterium]